MLFSSSRTEARGGRLTVDQEVYPHVGLAVLHALVSEAWVVCDNYTVFLTPPRKHTANLQPLRY